MVKIRRDESKKPTTPFGHCSEEKFVAPCNGTYERGVM
jgi:hypothetical protein